MTRKLTRLLSLRTGLSLQMTRMQKVFLLEKRLPGRQVQMMRWIYVTDTSYRLYIGLKQSGSFQHSVSPDFRLFLIRSHFSVDPVFGLSTIQHGQLSPLSGHYRCSTKYFHHFLYAMENKGADNVQSPVLKE